MLSSILTQRFDTSDIAFAKVDEEIAILREGIRALHAYRNTYTPVYRLPPEVLTRIFSLTMQIPNRDWYYGAGMFNRGVAVTRTSQHWRNVALASSSLWSHISSSYPKPIMEEWLKRSKAAPLYVNVYCTSPRDAQLFLVPLHRVRELTLELTTNAWNTFSSNMSSAAPLLEFLSITLNTSPPPEGIAEPTFWGGFPRLRHLHLSGCSFDTESSLFTDLVSLELCNPPNKVPEQALLSTLRNLPRLTLLTLLDVLDPSNPPVSAEIGAVSLSALQSLSIKGESFDQDVDILSHLSFPANSTLRFHSNIRTSEALHTLLAFLQVNHTARQSSSAPLIHNLDLYRSWNLLKLSLNPDSTESRYVANLLEFELRGHWNEFDRSDQSEMATLFSYLDLTTLTSLTSNWGLDIGTWTDVFGHLPNLKCISAYTPRSEDIINTIVNDFKDKCPPVYEKTLPSSTTIIKKQGKRGRGEHPRVQVASSSSSQPAVDWVPIFPKLEVLNLRGIYLPLQYNDFVSALRARKKVVMGVTSLVIQECTGMDQIVMDALSKVVSVTWDGSTGTDDEDNSEVEDIEEADYIPTLQDLGFTEDIDLDDLIAATGPS